MSKPLVFLNTKVRVEGNNEPVNSWELIALADCPVMHAAWNPSKQALVVQFTSVKENFVDFPMQSKSGKVTMQERRADQYYRLTIDDLEAVKYILDTYVGNFSNQFWQIGLPVPQVDEDTVPKQGKYELAE